MESDARMDLRRRILSLLASGLAATGVLVCVPLDASDTGHAPPGQEEPDRTHECDEDTFSPHWRASGLGRWIEAQERFGGVTVEFDD